MSTRVIRVAVVQQDVLQSTLLSTGHFQGTLKLTVALLEEMMLV